MNALRRLSDCVGAFIFRRNSITRLMRSGAVFWPSVFLFGAHFLRIFSASGTDAVAGVLQLFVESLLWLLAVFAVAEPALTMLARAAEDNPVAVYLAARRRAQARTACLFSLAVSHLLYSVVVLAIPPDSAWFVSLSTSAALVGYALLVRMIRVCWRFSGASAVTMSLAPLLAAMTAAMILPLPQVVPVAAALMLAALPVVAGDIRNRLVAEYRILRLSRGGAPSPEELGNLLDMVSRGGSERQARILLSRLPPPEKPDSRGDLRIRTLIAAGDYLEAVDAGLELLQAGNGSAKLHLVLAEANLLSDDPGNAAAHAQEASDLGAGPKALAILAVASFELGEREDGLAACRRILAFHRRGRGKESAEAARLARSLLRRYEFPPAE
jgi:hypothetical protein